MYMQVAVVKRWPVYTGGCCKEVACTVYTGGCCKEVACICRQLL